ncbi:hypothetical protein J5N97_020491 [Dioscorea zingiberensis]|uniref:Uncharacterized protein n=1 Tax=Dioscorea zingiberensis TaxID=325984 RepID=A0A9D5CFX3_9LILI|nr:hypothetical protein J5N97_020491 [Dioscorea zingiberensis]
MVRATMRERRVGLVAGGEERSGGMGVLWRWGGRGVEHVGTFVDGVVRSQSRRREFGALLEAGDEDGIHLGGGEEEGSGACYTPVDGVVRYMSEEEKGFYFIPGALAVEEQCYWIRESLNTFPQPPNRTNHTASYGPMYDLFNAVQNQEDFDRGGRFKYKCDSWAEFK